MKKQRILIVHNYYQIPGGEDTVVANEKKMLEENGHVVFLYSRHNDELKRFNAFWKALIPISMLFNPRTFFEVKRIIRTEKIDVVHVHNTLNLISPSVYYAAFACKVPVVQTVHNFRMLCPGGTFYRDGHICEDCVQKGLGCAIKHGCYRGSRAQTLVCVIITKIHRWLGTYKRLNYICLTEFNREKLLQMKGIKPEQVDVKPNFVNSDHQFVPQEERRNRYVFAGRLDKLKGIDMLLEAWKQMGAVAPELLICGTGPLEDWCASFIRENNLTMVKMLGFVPNSEVRELLASSRAMVLPTQWYEGFPMTIVEAFSVGTPVICSDLGNAGSVVQEGVTGYKFRHFSEIENCLDQVAENHDIYRHTYLHYVENYTEDQNVEVLNRIYAKAQ